MKKIASLGAALALAAGLSLGGATPASAMTLTEIRQAVLAVHNDLRKSKCGADSMKLGSSLSGSAYYHAQDMAVENYYGYQSLDPFETWQDRIYRFTGRTSGIAEVIGKDHSSVFSFMNWASTTSPSKTVIYDCYYDTIGVGYYSYGGRNRWVVDYGH